MRERLRLSALLFTLATIYIQLPAVTVDAGTVRVGDKFLVNMQTSENQQHPQVVALATGGFVVIWSGPGGENPFRPPAFGRTFDAFGAPVGPEFVLPDVFGERSIVAKDMSFVVSWLGPEIAQISLDGIVESSLQLEGGSLGAPALALSPLGEAIVVRDPSAIIAQRVDSDLQPIGSQFSITRGGDGNQYPHAPAVAAFDDSSFVVVWWAEASSALWGQVVDSADTSVGEPFPVVPPPELSDLSDSPAVCVFANGEFIVAWNDDDHATEFRIYYSDNEPPSGRLCSSLGSGLALSCLPGSQFLILGRSRDDIVGRLVNRTSLPIADFRIPVATVRDPHLFAIPTAAPLGDDTFVVVWSECVEGTENECNVFGQRFRITEAPRCPGDCNDDGNVSVDEIVRGISMALVGDANAAEICPQLDSDLDCQVAVHELVQAVGSALSGCN